MSNRSTCLLFFFKNSSYFIVLGLSRRQLFLTGHEIVKKRPGHNGMLSFLKQNALHFLLNTLYLFTSVINFNRASKKVKNYVLKESFYSYDSAFSRDIFWNIYWVSRQLVLNFDFNFWFSWLSYKKRLYLQ